MEADWWARGIAIAAATVGAASLGWNIFAWRRQGPVIKVQVSCSGRGETMTLSGKLHNKGRIDAQMVSARFAWRAPAHQTSRWTAGPSVLRAPLPIGHLDGVTLPLSVPAQRGAEFMVTGLNKIDPGLFSALHDQRDVTLAFRSATGAEANGLVRYRREPREASWSTPTAQA